MRAVIVFFMSLLAFSLGEMPKSMHNNALFRSQTQSSVLGRGINIIQSLSTSSVNKVLDLRGGSSDSVKEFTSLSDLEELMTSSPDKLIVIDFTATWCGPCKMISPIFHSLADSGAYPNAIFVKVDVDAAPEIAERFGVQAMPTFVFLKGDKVVDRFSGASEQKLIQCIEGNH